MLAIGAVIGAGIFGAIGTAAAGQVGPNGEVIRYGAGPALVFSFILLGGACALAALCYAELASMIPQAGSAYAYSYATLGELVAWIIGWDLILEYAVGNVAVAISWGDYFNTLVRGFGISLPAWLDDRLSHGAAQRRPRRPRTAPDRAARRRDSDRRPPARVRRSSCVITWLLLQGARESVTANNIMVVIKLLALGLFIAVGATHLHAENYHPFAPNGFTGIHQGAAIVFFAYIGFDAISTAAEETKNPQRNLPIGILGGLAICTVIYVIVGFVLTGMVPYTELAVADPLARALQLAGFNAVGWIVALGAAVSMSAVLLVFQYGQPRIFFAMARDGLLPAVGRRSSIPARRSRSRRRCSPASSSRSGRSSATPAKPTISPTSARCSRSCSSASACSCCATRIPTGRGRSACRSSGRSCLLSAAGCLFIMKGLPRSAWERFGIWLAIGLALYFVYGYQHSRLRSRAQP